MRSQLLVSGFCSCSCHVSSTLPAAHYRSSLPVCAEQTLFALFQSCSCPADSWRRHLVKLDPAQKPQPFGNDAKRADFISHLPGAETPCILLHKVPLRSFSADSGLFSPRNWQPQRLQRSKVKGARPLQSPPFSCLS